MHHYRLSDFDGIVKSISGNYQKDSLSDSDDIKQELHMKLIECLPVLQATPKHEIRLLVTSILRNHVRDIQRKSITRSGVNCKLEYHGKREEFDTFSWEDAADRAIMSLKAYIPEPFGNSEDACAYSLLKEHMLDWAEFKGGRAELLIREMLDPSEETLAEWKRMVTRFPSYKKFECIPPASFGRILGISKLTVHNIMEQLRVHLIIVGYSEDYVNNFIYTPKSKRKKING